MRHIPDGQLPGPSAADLLLEELECAAKVESCIVTRIPPQEGQAGASV
jgi:hypothetical protein